MLKQRIKGLDALRGITIISMITFHACWDLVYIYGMNWHWYLSKAAFIWQQSICWTFILLSGYCQNLGRHRFQRGMLTFGAGLAVSLVTELFMPEERIFCGVLSLLGSAMLLTAALDSLLKKIPAVAGTVMSFCMFSLLREVNRGYLGFGELRLLALPSAWYRNSLTAILGFPPASFFSTDYFSLLPWLMLFLAGYYFALAEQGRMVAKLANMEIPPLNWLGRHSLVVYLIHQPLIYGVLFVWFSLIA